MSLATKAVTVVERVEQSAVRELVAALVAGRVQPTSTPLDLRGVDPMLAVRPVVDLLAAWRERADVESEALGLALTSALEARSRAKDAAPQVEVVWTGPAELSSPLRQTAAVVHELIDAARSNILVVGYSITFDYLQRGATGRLLQDLLTATSRGVQITMVLHDDPQNLAQLTRAWPHDHRPPHVLVWPIPATDEMTKLHAKVVVVDGSDLLVTSANLTFHGLERNMEIGLRIRGPQAAIVRQRFDELERIGCLKPIARRF